MPKKPRKDEEYYKIDNNGCWVWLLSLDRDGYGQFGGRKYTKAVFYFYEKYVGERTNGLVLDHLCRNRACVNPKHLEEVSSAENVRRGRVTRLTANDIDKIRNDYYGGEKQIVIAKLFGINQGHVSKIINNQRWIGV